MSPSHETRARHALGHRASVLQPSATMAITARAGAMRREGVDVISLAAGEPDFPTPAHICEAGRRALDAGHTRYTPAAGIPELRAAAARYINERTGQHYPASQVIITNGAKQALFNTAFLLLDPDDAVVVPAPCWVTYPAQARLCGGRAVITPPRPDGSLDIDAVVDATARARMVILCNPSNPTGEVLGTDDLRRIGAAAKASGAWIVADEIYADLTYGDGGFTAFLQACPELADRTVVVMGASKTFAMTGWRIGFAAAPPALAGKMGALMSQTTSNPSSIAQYGALAALDEPADFLDDWRAAYDRRRRMLVAGLNDLDGVRCAMPGGAFYAFPDVRGLAEAAGCEDDVALAARLLDEIHIAVVPGTPFAAPGHVRLSYATSDADLERALERLRGWIANL